MQTPDLRGFSNNGVTQAPAPTAEILVLLGVPTGQHPDFQSTTASALPPYYPNIGANGPQYYAGRSDTNTGGGNGIVIVRTLKRTGPA